MPGGAHPLQGASSNIPRLPPLANSFPAFFERIFTPPAPGADAGPIILLTAPGRPGAGRRQPVGQ